MEADYLAQGWKITTKHADADLIVVRGCSVTGRAQAECERFIEHLKHHYPTTRLRVCGCLKNESSSLSPTLARTMVFTPPESQAVPTRTARAYLKVQDGCAGTCTFCLVPKFRGKSRSEGFAVLLDRARRFIEAGYHEIVVTGCNLSLYASEGNRLPDLVSALAELDAGCRIRIGSVEPGACALETVHAMAEHANVCRFLHLPIQSGAGSILLAMRRPYVVKDVEAIVALASKLMPNIGLGCDLMTGFPGESELDFAATRGLLNRMPFSNVHVFPFSERPGTPAAKLPRQLTRGTRSLRARELADLAAAKRVKFAKSFLGKEVEILIENDESGRGWTGEYLPCKPAVGHYARKSLARIVVTKVEDDLLIGRPR